MLAQIPSPSTGSIENVALALAAIGSMILLGKKLFARKTPEESAFVTKSEFHAELNGLRDKIDARFLNLSEKLDALKADLLAAAEHRSGALHRRINELESGLARVDERTKKQ